MLFYRAALPLSRQTLTFVSGLLRAHRREIGSPWRKLTTSQQALLVLVYLRPPLSIALFIVMAAAPAPLTIALGHPEWAFYYALAHGVPRRRPFRAGADLLSYVLPTTMTGLRASAFEPLVEAATNSSRSSRREEAPSSSEFRVRSSELEVSLTSAATNPLPRSSFIREVRWAATNSLQKVEMSYIGG